MRRSRSSPAPSSRRSSSFTASWRGVNRRRAARSSSDSSGVQHGGLRSWRLPVTPNGLHSGQILESGRRAAARRCSSSRWRRARRRPVATCGRRAPRPARSSAARSRSIWPRTPRARRAWTPGRPSSNSRRARLPPVRSLLTGRYGRTAGERAARVHPSRGSSGTDAAAIRRPRRRTLEVPRPGSRRTRVAARRRPAAARPARSLACSSIMRARRLVAGRLTSGAMNVGCPR